jgi:hypothetical protein
MHCLVDKIRVRGKDYYLVAKYTKTGAIHSIVMSDTTAVEMPTLDDGYRLMADVYRRLAVDLGTYAPGSKVELPLAAGGKIQVTIKTVTPDKVEATGPDGTVYTIPRLSDTATPQPVQTLAPEQPKLGELTVSAADVLGQVGEPDAPPATAKRRLSRHEIVDEAETLIRNSLAAGMSIGLDDIVDHMSNYYANSRDELFSGAELAWSKVEWENADKQQELAQ